MRWWLVTGIAVFSAGCGSSGSDAGGSTGPMVAESSTTSSTRGASTSSTTGDEGTTCGTSGCGEPGNCDESESGGSAGGDDTGFGMDGDPPLVASIPEIQRGEVFVYTNVLVEGLVVTSPVIPAPVGRGSVFTVSDPAGGLYSAITVRVDASPDEVSVERGEGVSVVATVGDGPRWLELRTLPEGIASEGVATEPPPVELDLGTLQTFANDPANARPYDSVALSLPPSETEDAGCGGELALTYGGLRVDDRFLDLPAASSLDAVGGILFYTLNGLEVAPRSAEELAP